VANRVRNKFAMKTPLRKTIFLLAIAGGLVALRFAVAGRIGANETIRVQRPLMGTTWSIEVADHGHGDAARHAIDLAYKELTRIDAMMSEWKPESPISQVNAAAGVHGVDVPPELREILERANRYSELSGGAFDITWHGMANIWHFDERFKVPSKAEVEEARKYVNYREIQIDDDRVYLPRKGMSIGLGGIAKGYAADRATEVLAHAGFTDTLVDGGGDIRVSGTRNGSLWQMGIQDPRGEHGALIGRVPAVNQAVVTSGDYERFRMVDGVRYHHIIDARTGWPATAASSVTVISKTAEQGVVLAKIMFIYGGEKALEIARAEKVEMLLIDTAGKRYATEGFKSRFEPIP
jgi:thiamine biosynthesis lipoprotein